MFIVIIYCGFLCFVSLKCAEKNLNAICIVAHHLNTNPLYKITWAKWLTLVQSIAYSHYHQITALYHCVSVCNSVLYIFLCSECVFKSKADHAYLYTVYIIHLLRENERKYQRKKEEKKMHEFRWLFFSFFFLLSNSIMQVVVILFSNSLRRLRSVVSQVYNVVFLFDIFHYTHSLVLF